MTYTAYTAIIVTFHNLSAILSLIIALIAGAVIYWTFVKGKKHRVVFAVLVFAASLVLGAFLTGWLFERAPVSVEIVQAG